MPLNTISAILVPLLLFTYLGVAGCATTKMESEDELDAVMREIGNCLSPGMQRGEMVNSLNCMIKYAQDVPYRDSRAYMITMYRLGMPIAEDFDSGLIDRKTASARMNYVLALATQAGSDAQLQEEAVDAQRIPRSYDVYLH